MLFTIRGLPATLTTADITKLIEEQCKLDDFVVGDMVFDGGGTQQTRIGVADEDDGAALMTFLNEFRIDDSVLEVLPCVKSKNDISKVLPKAFETQITTDATESTEKGKKEEMSDTILASNNAQSLNGGSSKPLFTIENVESLAVKVYTGTPIKLEGIEKTELLGRRENSERDVSLDPCYDEILDNLADSQLNKKDFNSLERIASKEISFSAKKLECNFYHENVQRTAKMRKKNLYKASNKCLFCKNSKHDLEDCPEFRASRLKILYLNHKKLCFKCLSGNHSLVDCKDTSSCAKCGWGNHHILICPSRQGSIQAAQRYVEERSLLIKCNGNQTAKDCMNNDSAFEIYHKSNDHTLICMKNLNKQPSHTCPYCQVSKHTLSKCILFAKLQLKDRTTWMQKNKICCKCETRHSGECNERYYCKYCGSSEHGSLICAKVNQVVPVLADTNARTQVCIYCKDSNHSLYYCELFRVLTATDRVQCMISKKICVICLSQHSLEDCELAGFLLCEDCGSNSHNTLFCDAAAWSQADPSKECAYCRDRSHSLYSCRVFESLPHEDQHAWIKITGWCVKCLRNHTNRPCTLKVKCDYCHWNEHHSLMCNNKRYCVYCKEASHLLQYCPKFFMHSLPWRKQFLSIRKLCQKCFGDHKKWNCPSKNQCRFCGLHSHLTKMCAKLRTRAYYKTPKIAYGCSFCRNKMHKIHHCKEYAELPAIFRCAWMTAKKLCKKSLSVHIEKACDHVVSCRHCGKCHDSLVCTAEVLLKLDAEAEEPQERDASPLQCLFCRQAGHEVRHCKALSRFLPVGVRTWAETKDLCSKCFGRHKPLDCRVLVACERCGSEEHESRACITLRLDAEYELNPTEACTNCRDTSHSLYQCRLFGTFTFKERWAWRQIKRICLKCLGYHDTPFCQQAEQCRICLEGEHYPLLCVFQSQVNKPEQLTYGCIFCSKPHTLKDCAELFKLEISTVFEILKNNPICKKCFLRHPIGVCTKTVKCQLCGNADHHSFVCRKKEFYKKIQESKPKALNLPLVKCFLCNDSTHGLQDCNAFSKQPLKARRKLIWSNKLCIKCFAPHYITDCRARVACKRCGQGHHELLCFIAGPQESAPEKPSQLCVHCQKSNHKVRDCLVFLALSCSKRHEWLVASSGLCLKCFEKHDQAACEAAGEVCKHCKGADHDTLVCGAEERPQPAVEVSQESKPTTSTQPLAKCLHCNNKTHALRDCGAFSMLPGSKRRLMHWCFGLCNKCMGQHRTDSCRESVVCERCNETSHHTLLCDEQNAVGIPLIDLTEMDENTPSQPTAAVISSVPMVKDKMQPTDASKPTASVKAQVRNTPELDATPPQIKSQTTLTSSTSLAMINDQILKVNNNCDEPKANKAAIKTTNLKLVPKPQKNRDSTKTSADHTLSSLKYSKDRREDVKRNIREKEKEIKTPINKNAPATEIKKRNCDKFDLRARLTYLADKRKCIRSEILDGATKLKNKTEEIRKRKFESDDHKYLFKTPAVSKGKAPEAKQYAYDKYGKPTRTLYGSTSRSSDRRDDSGKAGVDPVRKNENKGDQRHAKVDNKEQNNSFEMPEVPDRNVPAYKIKMPNESATKNSDANDSAKLAEEKTKRSKIVGMLSRRILLDNQISPESGTIYDRIYAELSLYLLKSINKLIGDQILPMKLILEMFREKYKRPDVDNIFQEILAGMPNHLRV